MSRPHRIVARARRQVLARYAADHDLDLLFFDPPETYDPAIIGLIYGSGQAPAVLYDEAKVLAGLRQSGMTADAAQAWFDTNTVSAYLGPATPRFLQRFP